MHKTRRRSLWRALASVVTGALVASAAIVGVALPADAAGVASVSVTQAPRAGGNVTVTGSGFDASAFGIYLSVRPNGTTTDLYTVWIDDTNTAASTPEGDTAPMTPAGDFTVEVPVPAYSDAGYSIVTRGAHGIPNATNTTTTPIVFEAVPATATQTLLAVSPATTAVEGTDVALTATVTPASAAGSVEFFSGTTSLGTAAVSAGTATRTLSTLPVGTLSLSAVFTAADATLFTGSSSAAVAYTVTANNPGPGTPTPTLTVSQAAGLDPASATITVTGTGYDATAKGLYGPTAGKPAGFYAQVGWLAPTWRPSEGATSGARTNAYSAWVQGTETASPYLRWTDNGDGTASFSWTVTIDKATLDAKKLNGATLAVFTTGAGGVVQAVNEKSVALSWASAPTLAVSQASDLSSSGATITVTGTGYDATAKGLYGPTAGKPAGFYAQVGWLAPTWRPSEGATSGSRANAYSAWVQGTETAAPYLRWTDNGDGTASFSWTVTIDKATLEAKKLNGATLAVFTTGAGGVVQAVNEKAVPISFTEPKVTVSAGTIQAGDTVMVSGIGFPAGQLATVEIHSEPVVLGTALIGGTGAFTLTAIVPSTVPGGSHTIVVTAPGVSVSTPVSVNAAPAPVVEKVCVANAVSGATIQWGMKASFVSYINGPIAKGSISGSWGTGSGAYNTTDNRGGVTYSGSVRYTGHSGVLDVTVSNLRVQVNSATAATLYGTTSAGTIALASLSLPSASVSGDRISWSNASASLTSAGSQLFSYNGNAFYPAGTALDPVSFTFPLGAQVPCDSTTNGTLAATGGDAPIDIAWIALALLVLGVGFVAARRRTARV